MHIFHAIILGIVEGLTEFLPISSTAHLALSAKLMGISSGEFIKSFEIIIQVGAIAAVAVLYLKEIFKKDIFWRLVVAFIPTAIIGFLLYKVIKQYLLSNFVTMAWALIIGGIIIIAFELWYKKREKESVTQISYGKCIIIGICQSLAIIPGVSRAAATIVSGLALGISRETIVKFSFLLAVPTLLGATVLDVYKSRGEFVSSQYGLLAIGFVFAFISAMLVITAFLKYIRKHDFKGFGIYRIVLGLLLLLFWL